MKTLWQSNTIRAVTEIILGQFGVFLVATTVEPVSWKLVVVTLLVPVLSGVRRVLGLWTVK